MKTRLFGTGAIALAITLGSTLETLAITNGVIVISTRSASDALYRQISSSTLYDANDYKGPGVFSPGDAAMAELLQDYGYSTRLTPEWLLRPDAIDPYGVYTGLTPETFYGGGGNPVGGAGDSNYLFSASLVIISGSGSSFDMPPPNTNGIPIIMGEHSCIGDRLLNGNSSLYMYSSINSGDVSSFTVTNQYMKVVAPNHPIMKGIPLDAEGRVKIFRDPYPEENAHVPSGGKPNWRFSWLTVDLDPTLTTPTVVAPDTQIIGVLATATNRVVFAVNPAGGQLAAGAPDAITNHGNFVQFFVNERGSGDSRRAFNNLTDLGKVIFIRTCKWAMGETLAPYQPLGLIRISQVSNQRLQLSWEGAATKSYAILGVADLLQANSPTSWQTVVQDIPGGDGTVSATLDISAAPKMAFLRVAPRP